VKEWWSDGVVENYRSGRLEHWWSQAETIKITIKKV
jgi:hypothetical protein